MAFLGVGHFLCEACKHFDTDGNDGNHPSCARQHGMRHRAIPLGEECPFGYEFGVPFGYPVSMERNERRAHEVKAMMERGASIFREYPFCGAECAEVIDEHQEFLEQAGVDYNDGGDAGWYAIVCDVTECGCGASTGWRPTEAEAAAAWNRRAEEDNEPKETE